MGMAVDEAVLVHCMERKSAPMRRFYEWDKASVSVGYAMNKDAEVNLSPVGRGAHRWRVTREFEADGALSAPRSTTHDAVLRMELS